MVVPEGIAAEDAVFLPSMETALSIVHDAGRPTTLLQSTARSQQSYRTRDTGHSGRLQATRRLLPCTCLCVPDSAGGGRACGSGGCGADWALGHVDPLAHLRGRARDGHRPLAKAKGGRQGHGRRSGGAPTRRRTGADTLKHISGRMSGKEVWCRHSPCRFCDECSADGPLSAAMWGRRAGWGTWIRAWSCRGWGQAYRPPSTPRGTAGRYDTGSSIQSPPLLKA